MRSLLVALFSLSVPAAAFAQSDASKSATQLWGDGSRLESEKEYLKAIEKYNKSLTKAIADKRNDVAAKCLVGIGRCNENIRPEPNVADALTSYKRVTAEFADQKDQNDWAAEKIKLNGVDVWVRVFAEEVSLWRDTVRNSAAALDKKKEEVFGKIKPLDKEAIYGLTASLSHADENVRLFVAWMLGEVIDGGGIAALVAKLGDKAYTAGAALALNKIFDKWTTANGFDKDAANIDYLLSNVKIDQLGPDAAWEPFIKEVRDRANAIKGAGVGGTLKGGYKVKDEDMAAANSTLTRLDELKRQWTAIGDSQKKGGEDVEKNRQRAVALRAKAAEIRHNIPQSLNSQDVQGAFSALIKDEGANPTGRIEALKCLGSIGEIGGDLVEAVLVALKSTNRNVRQAGCVAAAAVDTTRNEDKHKLINRMMEIVEHIAESDETQKDPANDALVRETACQALGQVGVIKAVPTLIKALNDNSASVRTRANDALRAISGKDVGYESEPHIIDLKHEMTEKQRRDKQLEIRKQGIQKWEQWWSDTGGIVVLVERFYRFAANWKSFPPAKLFDEKSFLDEIEARNYIYADPADAKKRASEACKEFQKRVNFHVQDAVDAGPAALDKLMRHLGGVIESDKGKYAAAPTRMFVGMAIAKIAEKSGASTVADKLGDLVGGGPTPEDKAGACIALGFMGRANVTAGARSSLEGRGLSGERVVKFAAAWALARVGDASSSGKPLADLACNLGEKDPEVPIAALRALAELKPQNDALVDMLSALIADEPETGTVSKRRAGEEVNDDLVRAAACDALGEIGSAQAVKNLGLVRGRRDTSDTVRQAAKRALQKVFAKNPGIAIDLGAILKDPKARADDRRGAALALGVTSTGSIFALVTTVTDENPPLKLRDADPSVRAAACRGLGEMKGQAKAKSVANALLDAMDKDIGEEVRKEAYNALCAIAGGALDAFNATDTQETRSAVVVKIREKIDAQNWPEPK